MVGSKDGRKAEKTKNGGTEDIKTKRKKRIEEWKGEGEDRRKKKMKGRKRGRAEESIREGRTEDIRPKMEEDTGVEGRMKEVKKMERRRKWKK